MRLDWNRSLQYIKRMTEFALYVHYPFCLSRCRYCGFASEVHDDAKAGHYHRALLKEMEDQTGKPPWCNGRLRSIYFGGGTPALMPPEYLNDIMEGVGNRLEYPPGIEVTLETNPAVCNMDNLRSFRELGVNRLSIGAQSFHDPELAFLGRIHSAADIKSAVEQARRAGFDNVSLDLIYGVPGQTVESFRISVQRALELKMDHLSTYALSIEKGTAFARLIEAGRLPKTDPDFTAEQYAELCRVMQDAGFDHYELTNFARPGRQSQHNWTYWRRIPYLGLGTAAHSFDGWRRCWNTRDTAVYIDLIYLGKTALKDEEVLLPEEEIEEIIYLGLRTMDGVDEAVVGEASTPETVNELLSHGFLIRSGGRLHVPENKWLLLDEIAVRLLSKNPSI